MKALLISSAAFAALILTGVAADARGFRGGGGGFRGGGGFHGGGFRGGGFRGGGGFHGGGFRGGIGRPGWGAAGPIAGRPGWGRDVRLPAGPVGVAVGSAGATLSVAAMVGVAIVPMDTGLPRPGSVQPPPLATTGIGAATEAAGPTPTTMRMPAPVPRIEAPRIRSLAKRRATAAGSVRHADAQGLHPEQARRFAPESTQHRSEAVKWTRSSKLGGSPSARRGHPS